jgi:chromosome segregation ATPase
VSARLLTILNAVGCLVLGAFIVVQWQGGQSLSDELQASRSAAILEANARIAAERTATQLQADIDGLKASIDSIQQSVAATEKELAAKAAEAQALAGQLSEAQEQLKARDAAVQARDEALALRDEKLQELNDSLVATRKRLDEAVAALKAAGAR